MHAIRCTNTKTNKTWLFQTAFNVERKPEVVTYDTAEQAEADISVMRKVAAEDSLSVQFDIVDYDGHEPEGD